MNKYTTSADNHWADMEIDRWQLKTLGVNPIRHYISRVVSLMLNAIPEDVVNYTGVDYWIIEDVITQNPDDFMERNIYDFYEQHFSEEQAARYLGKILEEYMLG